MRPAPVPLTMQAVSDQGAYLMDCGRVFVMWLGRGISPDFMAQVCSHVCSGLAQRQQQVPKIAYQSLMILSNIFCCYSYT